MATDQDKIREAIFNLRRAFMEIDIEPPVGFVFDEPRALDTITQIIETPEYNVSMRMERGRFRFNGIEFRYEPKK